MRAKYFGIYCFCWRKVISKLHRLYGGIVIRFIGRIVDLRRRLAFKITTLASYSPFSSFNYMVFCFTLVPHVLLSCLPIIHGLFSSILKFWEQSREPKTCDCPTQLRASVQMMSIFRKAMWLPRPLCLVGDIFHIISPKEIHKLLGTIWEFFKVIKCLNSMGFTTG